MRKLSVISTLRTLFALAFIAIPFTGTAFAQQRGAQAAPPALLDCGLHGEVEILCGARSPEDLEVTPDGKYLIVSPYVTFRGGGAGVGFMLYDLSKKAFTSIPILSESLKDWGDADCPGPIGAALAPHGISLGKRANGMMELYVVNHGSRQSIEMFELKQASGNWSLVWHGCTVSATDFNDVAVMPDGGFIGTHPTSIVPQPADIFSGQPTGVVSRWIPGKGETELAGTKAGYPNGVLASPDGRFVYFNAWTAKEVHKYDLQLARETGVVKLDFMPDNITWTSKGELLAAGVKGTRGDCPAGSGSPCSQGFGVAVIDPAKMEMKTVFDSAGKGALISGVSVALQVGDEVFIGAYQGDRLVRINWKQ